MSKHLGWGRWGLHSTIRTRCIGFDYISKIISTRCFERGSWSKWRIKNNMRSTMVSCIYYRPWKLFKIILGCQKIVIVGSPYVATHKKQPTTLISLRSICVKHKKTNVFSLILETLDEKNKMLVNIVASKNAM